MHKQLLIIGARGQGKVVADIAAKLQCYEEIGFLDDDESLQEALGYPVLGKSAEFANYTEKADIFVAIGNAQIRRKLQEKLLLSGAFVPTLIHPKAIVGANVKIGAGTVVMAGAVINPDCVIGKGCIINTSCSIDHECSLGDYVHVSVGSHLAGNVLVGENTWIGIGAIISNNINISQDCFIGAGAVVVHNIEQAGTYVGVPAKMIK